MSKPRFSDTESLGLMLLLVIILAIVCSQFIINRRNAPAEATVTDSPARQEQIADTTDTVISLKKPSKKSSGKSSKKSSTKKSSTPTERSPLDDVQF